MKIKIKELKPLIRAVVIVVIELVHLVCVQDTDGVGSTPGGWCCLAQMIFVIVIRSLVAQAYFMRSSSS